MPFNIVDQIVIGLGLALAGLIYVKNKKWASYPYPPGPRKLPLLGNLMDLPRERMWVEFARWGKEHSEDSLLLIRLRV